MAGLYADTLASAIGNAKALTFKQCAWGATEAEQLAAVLPLAQRLERLDVSNGLGTRGHDALAAAIRGGAAPELKEVRCQQDEEDLGAELPRACRERGIRLTGGRAYTL